ncbi:nucleotidyl transferase AbiEii/AbiGii toxin family protein [Legionella sp. 29fVS95]|uniref:nucleotidyl transferase AbiEii/AbiGii toxin family protein n=1 Tax=Legionella sp. 29fVS95 TaxID=3402813 RepID=UPI003AF84149
MSFEEIYKNQVALLLEVLPVVSNFKCFALKGGTAINLFIRDMPRLSVDIDLTYLPIESRDIFLVNIEAELIKMKRLIEKLGLVVKDVFTKNRTLAKLQVFAKNATIKIEPNFVLRGSVFACEEQELCEKAQDQFLKFMRINTLSIADLYGGKICAALDRYHPRDLFDLKLLLDNQGLTEQIRQAFIVYLASGSRPMHELLDPKISEVSKQEFEKTFKNEFLGMTDTLISHEELSNIRADLPSLLLASFTDNERNFLLTLKSGTPDWSLLPIEGIETLPGIQWKLRNINKITDDKKKEQLNKLKQILEM